MRDVAAALGSGRVLSPFFRAPYFELTDALQRYLSAAGIVVWGADFMADDWSGISGEAMVRLALERIEARGRGVLLLHDVMAPTVAGLPRLLRELKLRDYHIVRVVAVPTGEATSASAR
jgi:peptidoglycan-N-acetylglucosamine deacetylase